MPAIRPNEKKLGSCVVTTMLTQAEAQIYTGLSERTFTRKSAAGGLPWYGDAHNKRYDEAELVAWIKNGYVFPDTDRGGANMT